VPQSFNTIAVQPYAPVLYQLGMRAPDSFLSEFATYTFPLSPSSIRYEPSSASSFGDVHGPAQTRGVTRYVDRFGLTPPMITIEGTTGWDRHQSDGYILTGLQSIQLLQQFLAQYATLNETQLQSGNPQLYTLEFSDYFLNQFWVVEPIGPQVVRQSADKPTLVYYRFRWAAVAPLGLLDFAIGEADALLQVFGTPAAAAAVNAATTLGAMLVAYSPAGPVSSVLGAV